jgi:hypothetical protein
MPFLTAYLTCEKLERLKVAGQTDNTLWIINKGLPQNSHETTLIKFSIKENSVGNDAYRSFCNFDTQ